MNPEEPNGTQRDPKKPVGLIFNSHFVNKMWKKQGNPSKLKGTQGNLREPKGTHFNRQFANKAWRKKPCLELAWLRQQLKKV